MPNNKKQQAIFPDLPRDSNIIDPATGQMLNSWMLYFQQLTQALQTNYNQEGLVIPSQSAENLAMLGNTEASIGNIIYDYTNNQFKAIVLVSLGPPIVTATKTFTIT